MIFRQLRGITLSFAMMAVICCGGSRPTEEAAEERPTGATEEAQAVFEEDFEAGDAEEWAETDGQAEEAEADPASESDRE